jgi:hypothetical protein
MCGGRLYNRKVLLGDPQEVEAQVVFVPPLPDPDFLSPSQDGPQANGHSMNLRKNLKGIQNGTQRRFTILRFNPTSPRG